MGAHTNTSTSKRALLPSQPVLSARCEDPTWPLSAEADPGSCLIHTLRPQVRSPEKKQLCPMSYASSKGRMRAGVSRALVQCSFHRKKKIGSSRKQLGQGDSQRIWREFQEPERAKERKSHNRVRKENSHNLKIKGKLEGIITKQ